MTRMLRRRLGSGLRLYGAWLWEAGISRLYGTNERDWTNQRKKGQAAEVTFKSQSIGSYACDLYVFDITVVKVPLSLISRFLLDW